MEHLYKNAWLKAKLLAGRTVGLSSNVNKIREKVDTDNHHRDEWIFLKIGSNSRVRLVVSETPSFWMDTDENGRIYLQDSKTQEHLIPNVVIENAVIHAPKQLFLGLYEYCRIGCKFCPLASPQSKYIHYSLDSIFEDIDKSKEKDYTSIGITTAIPYHLSSDDVADEMTFAVTKIREKVGSSIPIGISTRIPSQKKLQALKAAGATEARLNIEIPNDNLSKKYMPNKPIAEIIKSIKLACDVFGRGKVSSNIILGLGENDKDVLECAEMLAQEGAIATLYPYDPAPNTPYSNIFQRPDSERLYQLSVAHKNILKQYKLNPEALLTMCPACAASHILPGKDL